MQIIFINILLIILTIVLLYYGNLKETFASSTGGAFLQLMARGPEDQYEIGGESPNIYTTPFYYAYDFPLSYNYYPYVVGHKRR